MNNKKQKMNEDWLDDDLLKELEELKNSKGYSSTEEMFSDILGADWRDGD